VREDLLKSKIMLVVAAMVVATALWAAFQSTPVQCLPLMPPESLWMPRGATTCDLPMEGLSPADRK